MGGSVVEVSAQFEPFQKKCGFAAVPPPLAEMNPIPVTTLQMWRISGTSRRMSRPFSLGPLQAALVPGDPLVDAQVRIAVDTICVGVNWPTGGRLSGPRGPVAP